MNHYREQWAGARRIGFDTVSTGASGWRLDYKITNMSLEDRPNWPCLVPTIGLRQDGHMGKAQEGQPNRTIAGFYDSFNELFIRLEVYDWEFCEDNGMPMGPDKCPAYEVVVKDENGKTINTSGYNELEYALSQFVRELPDHYQYDEPIKWLKPKEQLKSEFKASLRARPGYGEWA